MRVSVEGDFIEGDGLCQYFSLVDIKNHGWEIVGSTNGDLGWEVSGNGQVLVGWSNNPSLESFIGQGNNFTGNAGTITVTYFQDFDRINK